MGSESFSASARISAAFLALRPPGSRIVAKTVCPFRASVSANSLPKPVLEPVMRTTCLEFMFIASSWSCRKTSLMPEVKRLGIKNEFMTPVSRIPSAVGAAPRTVGRLLSLFYFLVSRWLGGHRQPTRQAGQRRRELAGGEGAEAGGEFGVGEAALAKEPAEEVFGGGLPLFRVAIATARDEVAVGIAPRLRARNDMVDGPYEDGKAAQTVKAEATLARVDGLAKSIVFEEIGVRDAGGERQPGRAAGGDDIRAEGANLHRQADHDHVTDLVAFDQTQDAEIEEAPKRATRGHLA